MNSLLFLIGKLPLKWLKAVSRSQWLHPALKTMFDFAAKMLRGRDGIIQQGVGKGLRFNPGSSNAGYLLGSSEPQVQTALATLLRQDMVVYDVGANVGFLSLIAARLVTAGGRVVCFDPLPANIHHLAHNVALNGFAHVAIRSEALGKVDGEAQFQVAAESTWGKLIPLNAEAAPALSEITVLVRRLDTLLMTNDLPKPNLIKIDVEGGEKDMLLGAVETIQNFRPLLLIELHGTNSDVAALLEGWRYQTMVLGSKQSVTAAPWDAYVLAAPSENLDALGLMASLAKTLLPHG